MPTIIESLLRWPFISEIIIIDNSKRKNTINEARYTAAKRAENDWIYTQDDDCIVHGVDKLYKKFCEDPDTIVHGGTPEYESVIKDNIYGNEQMAMFGWGAIFNRKWIGVLDKYVKKYGKDYCYYRETDRIFTVLQKKLHNFVLSDIEHLEGATADYALCKKDDHVKYKELSIKRALAL